MLKYKENPLQSLIKLKRFLNVQNCAVQFNGDLSFELSHLTI